MNLTMVKKGKATEDLLNSLHEAVARDLLNKVASGSASAQELQAAIKFLKDNGIEADVQTNTDMHDLAKVVLPSFSDDDDVIAETLN